MLVIELFDTIPHFLNSLSYFLIIYFVEVQFIYNVMIISAVQRSDTAKLIYVTFSVYASEPGALTPRQSAADPVSWSQLWLSQGSPPPLSCGPASGTHASSFLKEKGLIFPFPGCNRLRPLPSGRKCWLSFTTEVIDLFAPTTPHPTTGEKGEDLGLDVSFCSDAVWLSPTCSVKGTFLRLSLVIFLSAWWSLWRRAWKGSLKLMSSMARQSLASPYSASTSSLTSLTCVRLHLLQMSKCASPISPYRHLCP